MDTTLHIACLRVNMSSGVTVLISFASQRTSLKCHMPFPNLHMNSHLLQALAEIVAESVNATFSVNGKDIRRTQPEPQLSSKDIEEFNKLNP